MDLTDLKQLAEAAQRRLAMEQKKQAKDRLTKANESEWTRARNAVTALSHTLTGAAKAGQRWVEVYHCCGRYHCQETKLGFFSGGRWRTEWILDGIPEWGLFVFNECQKRGLDPEWRHDCPYERIIVRW